MRDPYTDNNLIDYYTQNYIQFRYLLVTIDLRFSFYSLPSNDPQFLLSWAPGLPPAKSGTAIPHRVMNCNVVDTCLVRILLSSVALALMQPRRDSTSQCI